MDQLQLGQNLATFSLAHFNILPQPVTTSNLHIATLHCQFQEDVCFWNSKPISATDENLSNEFLQQYMKTHIGVRPDEAYSLHFPWKENHPPLPSNFSVCYKWTRSMVHRLSSYWNSMTPSQQMKGFIEWVDDSDHARTIHYIPHHLVRKESTTTPIRMVYDCSCKQSHNSPSLNDCLQAGPPFLNDLSGILLRFRQHDLAFSTDIEKACLPQRDRLEFHTIFMAIRSWQC